MKEIENSSVLKFFEEISKIPRNSGNENAMQLYLIDFAKSRGLKYFADKYNNVIIYKKTCECEPIILQAHTDMVCVKTPKSKINFNLDPITLIKKGKYIKAKDTSLGADDGIGVALILDILNSSLPCNIEAVFTSSEETTMNGALNIDVKQLKSKKLICLDGFSSATIVTASAGFVDYYVSFNNERLFIDKDENLKTYKLIVFGLEGGHSGFDIDKNRGSSHKIMAELLTKIEDAKLIKFNGGHNYNVIPNKTECVFNTKLNPIQLKQIIKYFYKQNKLKYKHLKIKCSRQLNQNLVLKNGKNFIDFVNNFNQGVLQKDENNFVLSSQNISEVSAENGYLKIGIRSCSKTKEKEIIENLNLLCAKFLLQGKVEDSQPAFNTLENSSLLKNLKNFSIGEVKQTKMHIAVECGIFQERIKNLDVVIISPTILNAHSVNESLEISTVEFTSSWLKNFLTNN